MAEIGIAPVPENNPSIRRLRDHFLNLVREATRSDTGYRFPGTMPLTLSRRHLGMVAANDYVALEKSDGTRYMLFAIPTAVFLIDRSMRFYAIDPNPKVLSQGFSAPQENTILDGELTYNKLTSQWDYLIYDCVCIDNDLSVASRAFRERMLAAENYVAGPRVWAPFCAGLLRLRIKDYYEIKEIRKLFAHIKIDPKGHYLYINNSRRDGVLCNENDGVILAPVGMPYQVKKCSALLKWKPPHLNSIDFTLQLERTVDRRTEEPSVVPFIAYKGERGVVRLREVYFPSKLKRMWAADFARYHNAIVELAYDKKVGEWRYIRLREDKDGANFSSTVIDTLETMVESMEKEELVNFLERYAKAVPKDQQDFVTANAKNVESCTFRDDFFDETNHDFLLTAPISLTLPPNIRHPPNLRPAGAPRYENRGKPKKYTTNDDHTNGKRTHRSGPGDQEDGERPPVTYEDDV